MNGFDAQPTPRNIPWKPVAIIAGAVILAVVLVVVAIMFVRSRQERISQEIAVERLSAQVDKALVSCDSEGNPQTCKDAYVKDAAVQRGVVELCGKSGSEAAADDCVWQTAAAFGDPEMCGTMNDKDTAANCRDGIYMASAQDSLNLDTCGKITNEPVRERCVNSVSRDIAAEQGCEGTGVDQAYCDDLELTAMILTLQDPADCALFEDESVAERCHELVGSGDKDGDGLSADDEDAYGTSDRNADSDGDGLNDVDEVNVWHTDPTLIDSDGDGYGDGDEVAAGYDPMGLRAL